MYPAGKYLFNVVNKNNKTMFMGFVIVSLLLILNRYLQLGEKYLCAKPVVRNIVLL